MRLWRERRWRRLYLAITALGSTSHFANAQAQDDEAAVEYLRYIEGKPTTSSTSLVEFGTNEALLAGVYDALQALISITLRANSKPGAATPRMRPWPRPQTAIDRVKREQNEQKYADIRSQMLRRE